MSIKRLGSLSGLIGIPPDLCLERWEGLPRGPMPPQARWLVLWAAPRRPAGAQRPKPLRGTIDRGGQAGGAPAHDHEVEAALGYIPDGQPEVSVRARQGSAGAGPIQWRSPPAAHRASRRTPAERPQRRGRDRATMGDTAAGEELPDAERLCREPGPNDQDSGGGAAQQV